MSLPDLRGFRAVVEAVADERLRQVTDEGFTAAADDGYRQNELSLAAAAYLVHGTSGNRSKGVGKRLPDGKFKTFSVPEFFPRTWLPEWFKPKNRRRDLVRAAALIIADIERIDRLEKLNFCQSCAGPVETCDCANPDHIKVDYL
jgi:hypothetical protein